MNNKLLIGLMVVLGVVGGMVGAVLVKGPLTGGDYAGGIQPSQLFTGNVTTNSVTPNLANLLVSGAVSAGGIAANNQITAIYTAVQNFPTIGGTFAAGATPSSTVTSTNIAFSANGFAVGDTCEIEYNFTTSTLLTSGNVSAVSGSNVTTTVTFLNATGLSVSDAATSTITGVSSTVKATCYHTGV
jgi:hypothetical protein